MESYSIKLQELDLSTGKLIVITPTECVKDWLTWYFYTADKQSLLHEMLVARDQPVDLMDVRKWSEAEGKKEEFENFLENLKERESAQRLHGAID